MTLLFSVTSPSLLDFLFAPRFYTQNVVGQDTDLPRNGACARAGGRTGGGLLLAQGSHGINAGGATGRNVRGQQGHGENAYRHNDVDPRFANVQVIEHGLKN